MRSRMPSPVTAMKLSGHWAKVGSKQYRNAEGTVISYNHTTFRWEINGEGYYSTLWMALLQVDPRLVGV